ncbi:MAG TPA: histidine phosphatase family protein [Candidatus Eisenbacteria bacterium]|nr:histidine phosphatase family protein [Candidatus Eisenbacteria bacterium]
MTARKGNAPRRKRSLGAAAIALSLSGSAAASLAGAGLAAAAGDAPQGVRYVCLIRHAIYDRVDSLDEKTANGLNSLGREQAALVAARLAALPVKADRFVSSDLLRALETSEAIGKAIGRTAERDSLLAECTSPSSRPGLDETSDPAELAACRAAMEAAWAKYFTPSPASDAHDVIVCHGNVIRWFVNRALGNDVRHWTSLDIGNASLTVISVRADGTTRLVMFSDVGHLPVAKQTWAGKGGGWGPAKP